MYVEIRERQEDGSERTVAVFRHEGNVVTCDNAVIWNHLVQATGGVVVGSRGRRYTPHDGESYLRNLRFQYRGPYLFAREIADVVPAVRHHAVDPHGFEHSRDRYGVEAGAAGHVVAVAGREPALEEQKDAGIRAGDPATQLLDRIRHRSRSPALTGGC